MQESNPRGPSLDTPTLQNSKKMKLGVWFSFAFHFHIDWMFGWPADWWHWLILYHQLCSVLPLGLRIPPSLLCMCVLGYTHSFLLQMIDWLHTISKEWCHWDSVVGDWAQYNVTNIRNLSCFMGHRGLHCQLYLMTLNSEAKWNQNGFERWIVGRTQIRSNFKLFVWAVFVVFSNADVLKRGL